MSISARGEVIEDPEMSPRMETSSEDSVPGGLMMMQIAAEQKEKDCTMADSVLDDQKPIIPSSNLVEQHSFKMHNAPSSQLLTADIPANIGEK
jgi:hypothetical protein